MHIDSVILCCSPDGSLSCLILMVSVYDSMVWTPDSGVCKQPGMCNITPWSIEPLHFAPQRFLYNLTPLPPPCYSDMSRSRAACVARSPSSLRSACSALASSADQEGTLVSSQLTLRPICRSSDNALFQLWCCRCIASCVPQILSLCGCGFCGSVSVRSYCACSSA